jgi:hypothetical protein
MLNIEAQEVPFSFDQPDEVLTPLVTLLQQALNKLKTRADRGKVLPVSRQVLIIDAHAERARYIARLLASVNYQPMMAPTALEAFTLFLRGTCVPLAIILGQEEASHRLFLHRLLQQMLQRYAWEVPLIRLLSKPSHGSLAQSTVPLPSGSSTRFPARPQTTSPLPPLAESSGWSPSLQHTPLPAGPDSFGPNAPTRPTTAPLSGTPDPATRLPSAPLPSLSSQPPSSHLYVQEQPGQRAAQPREQAGERREIKPVEEEKVTLEGHDIGRYHILSPIVGSSSASHTYLAYDRLREQNVALKAIRTTSLPYHLMENALEEANLFQQEKALLGQLEHPHILQVLNAGKSYVSGAPFIYKTMLHYEAGSLADWLHQQSSARTFAPQEVIQVILQIGDALQLAHSQNITYQNFKLTNVLIREREDDMRRLHVFLTDFAIPQDGTFSSRSLDALPYIAPERWNGQVLPASDQYGLAALAYELLAGRPPFQGNSENIMKHLHTNMPPQPPDIFNPALPASLNKILLRGLAKKPEERFASISIFVRLLQQQCF